MTLILTHEEYELYFRFGLLANEYEPSIIHSTVQFRSRISVVENKCCVIAKAKILSHNCLSDDCCFNMRWVIKHQLVQITSRPI